MLQLFVHPVSAISVGTWPAVTFCLSFSSLVHAGGVGRGSGAWEGIVRFRIGGAGIMR